MSLIDKLEAANQVGAGLPCKIGSVLKGNKLTPEERAKLIEVLEVPVGVHSRLSNVTIARALRDEGYDVSDSSVNKHRRGGCRCFGNSPKFSVDS